MLKLYQSMVSQAKTRILCASMEALFKERYYKMLEKVQKRATRLMFRDKSSSFGERLQQSGLTTLEIRRLHGDLIEMFKIFKGFNDKLQKKSVCQAQSPGSFQII